MKIYKFASLIALGLGLAACSQMDEMLPQSGTLLRSQVQQINQELPERAEATFAGIFSDLGYPAKLASRPDDFGFIMMNLSNDLEGPDAVFPNSNYNWFSVCGEYSSRNANYANPRQRYRYPYNTVGAVNDFLGGFAEDVSDPNAIYMMAQARAVRAYAYFMLAQGFQFNYQIAADKPCVPITTPETPDVTNNPRATVQEVYDYILADLNYAVENLEGYKRVSKMYIDKSVALGLRARVYLVMGKWAEAAADAQKAMEGYTPASIKEVSKPAFMDINEHNWMWGYDMTESMAGKERYATASSWLASFSGWSYSAGTGCYAMINTLLWNKIPATDVRKGWWVDGDLKSPLLNGLTWNGKGDVANLKIDDEKEVFLPYTNVKFGCNPIGTTTNSEDYPFMRVEEMILIQAEGLARSGNSPQAREILTSFVKKYRDPSYDVAGRGLSLENEIWFQRRVELWGEGFGIFDVKRLNRPLVRTHGSGTSNWPDAFAFNLPADDPYLLLRFPQGELNTNFGIVDNSGGKQPVADQNNTLRDGITD